MRRLHAFTERSIVFAVRETSRSIQLLYKCILTALYCMWLPIRETLKYIGFVVSTIYKRYAYEWYLLFTINMIWMGVAGYLTIPKIVRKIELDHKAPIIEIATNYTKDYLYSLDTWPFTTLKAQHRELVETKKALVGYKFAAGEMPIPIDQVIQDEAYKQGIPLEVAFAIVKQENGAKNPLAFYAGNRNRTLDTGIMQVNSSNFKMCGISIVEAFNPKINIGCGMRILRDAYSQAQDLVMQKRKPKSCTGARDEEELILEYTGRIYNGGAGVFAKGNTSCAYAMNLRRKYAGLEPIDYAPIDQVADVGWEVKEQEEEQEEKSFWAWLF